MHPALITPEELNAQLNQENLILLDVSIPKVTGGGPTNNSTIPGAIVVDFKREFSDAKSKFPNTIPSVDQFENTCDLLGISNESKVVVFDNIGIYSSPRIWWLFSVMGHKNIQVLDGGIPAWQTTGFPTIEGVVWDRTSMKPVDSKYEAYFQSDWVKSYDEILSNSSQCQFLIVDARSSGRFNGTAPEPREGLKSGHIPHSCNLPYQDVLNGNYFKSIEELKLIFKGLNINDDATYSCGSGLTACIILLASHIAGYKSMNVYDGSWTEWAELQGLKS